MLNRQNRLVEILDLALCDGTSFQPPSSGKAKYITDLEDCCYELFLRDFNCQMLDNSNGQLCSTYPSRIIIPLSQRAGFTFNDPGGGTPQNGTKHESMDMSRLNDCINKAKYARTRCRFPVPSFVIDGKLICRSSTLARSPEIYARVGYSWYNSYFVQQGETSAVLPESESDEDLTDKSSLHKSSPSLNNDLFNGNMPNGNTPTSPHSNVMNSSSMSDIAGFNEYNIPDNKKSKEWIVDKMRNLDVNLLNMLNIDMIYDFMVEHKKVKFGLNVTSSEKADGEQRYSPFHLLSVPYPGCEFFAEYQKCDYKGEGLKFDWQQNFVDAQLRIPVEVDKTINITWNEYVNWDLIKLTQNYLALLLDSLTQPISSGILLHCISGWDRTPLFVSILRLSLWADGLIHESLSAEEIVFLTVAYDWLLFSHQFSDRIDKGEEIMYFCFDFLSYITSNKFSLIDSMQKKSDLEKSKNGLSDSIFMLESYYSNLPEVNHRKSNGLVNTDLGDFHKNCSKSQKCNSFEDLVLGSSDFNCESSSKVSYGTGYLSYSNEHFNEASCAINGNNVSYKHNTAGITKEGNAAVLHVKDQTNSLNDHKNCDMLNQPTTINRRVKATLSYSMSAPASPKSSNPEVLLSNTEESQPINIPKLHNRTKRIRSGSLDFSLNDITSSDGECGVPNGAGSWQLVSLQENISNSMSHESDDNAFKHTGLQNDHCEAKGNIVQDEASLKEELYQRRKERLVEAKEIFLPAYKQSIACRQQQGGAIANIINQFRFKLST